MLRQPYLYPKSPASHNDRGTFCYIKQLFNYNYLTDVLLFFDINTIPANAQSINTTYNAIGVVSPVFTVSSVDSVVPLTSLSFPVSPPSATSPLMNRHP